MQYMSTILVIDDHPAFRLVIKMQLMQLLGVEEVIEAYNGQIAVEMARQHTPKLERRLRRFVRCQSLPGLESVSSTK